MLTQIVLPSDFPWDDIGTVVQCLVESDFCVPGYIPPPAGLWDPQGFLYASHVEGVETVILPDRNVVSRWVQTVNGHSPLDSQHRSAAALVAFAQCFDIQIEPSIAFHELATAQGMATASDELAWFRSADNHRALDWIGFALGRTDRLYKATKQPPIEVSDLTKPLNRWRRNYVLALKIAELSLTTMTAKARVQAFFDWMYRDFVLGGPAALLALIYFAPQSAPRKRLLKGLRSEDRERAIQGIRNAAWDLTHLSDFIGRMQTADQDKKHFIFASFDDGLRRITRLGIGPGEGTSAVDHLVHQLSAWWPEADARELAGTLLGLYARGRPPGWLEAQAKMVGYIESLTEKGERMVRGWKP